MTKEIKDKIKRTRFENLKIRVTKQDTTLNLKDLTAYKNLSIKFS